MDRELIQHLSLDHRVRVLVVGDIMLDRYVVGSVERISPEAPVPVLKFQHEALAPGAAANVARNVCAFGAEAILVGLVGKDASGADLTDLIAKIPGCRFAPALSPSRPTTTKTRLMADRHQIMRLDIEEAHPADAAEEAIVLEALAREIGHVDILVLSDYRKGTLTPNVIAGAIRLARARGLAVVVDPKHDDFRLYEGATLVTPNRSEFTQAVGPVANEDNAIAEAAEGLLQRVNLEGLLVTRSEKGMTLVRRGQPPVHLHAWARQVADVTGAGDTVVALLAVLLAEGLDAAGAATAANLGAGLVVEKPGTATVTRQELVTEIRYRLGEDRMRKVLTKEGAAQMRQVWRGAGERVVFTNGCFDLLHPGHIALLTGARGQGDRLIVGLNTDASVMRLKGPERPVQDQDSRAVVLAALDCVDAVVHFEEDTPLELIETLLPDVLVKGADYRVDQVVGREVVERHGGRVALVNLKPGHSTTGTIARLRAGER